jgi:hypothetical protein
VAVGGRMHVCQGAETHRALAYLADTLPQLSRVQMDELTQVESSLGHQVFEGLIAEAGYTGVLPQLAPPKWTVDSVDSNALLDREDVSAPPVFPTLTPLPKPEGEPPLEPPQEAPSELPEP